MVSIAHNMIHPDQDKRLRSPTLCDTPNVIHITVQNLSALDHIDAHRYGALPMDTCEGVCAHTQSVHALLGGSSWLLQVAVSELTQGSYIFPALPKRDRFVVFRVSPTTHGAARRL